MSVIRALAKLEAFKLIERERHLQEKSNALAANKYTVHEPKMTNTSPGRSTAERPSTTQGLRTPERHMKGSETKHVERAPVAAAPAPLDIYGIRRIAARFRELHHGESDYTKDRLRADVRTALIGEGREPDDRLIDEAIGI
jgi:hypothetical protein